MICNTSLTPALHMLSGAGMRMQWFLGIKPCSCAPQERPNSTSRLGADPHLHPGSRVYASLPRLVTKCPHRGVEALQEVAQQWLHHLREQLATRVRDLIYTIILKSEAICWPVLAPWQRHCGCILHFDTGCGPSLLLSVQQRPHLPGRGAHSACVLHLGSW